MIEHLAEPRTPRRAGGVGVPSRACVREAGWPLERVLFAMAGTVTLLSVLLAALVTPWLLVLTAFVGVSQWLYVLFGACPSSMVVGRAFGLRSAVYRHKGVAAR